jgi:hypothetical protein
MMTTSRQAWIRFSSRTGVLGVALLAGLGATSPAWAQAAPMPVSTAAPAPAPAATLDGILRQLSAYDGGIESAAAWKLRDYVRAHRDDPAGRTECETKLLAFLKTTATRSAKMEAARHLRVISGDTAVPALSALLIEGRSSDVALYVLQQIPGASAEQALVTALKKTTGATTLSVIAALGERRSEVAVSALVPLLSQPTLATSVGISLGRIGSDTAGAALSEALPTASALLKPTIAAAMLSCAERHVAAGNIPTAARLYDAVRADTSLPTSLAEAAAIGQIACAPNKAALAIEYLGSADAVSQAAAMVRLQDVVPPEGVAPVCLVLPRLSEPLQIKVLAALATYPAGRVLAAVLGAARRDSEPVRIAAIKALESTGGAAEVPFLVERAATAHGAEQIAARWALGRLRGQPVDEAILAMFGREKADETGETDVELLQAVAERRIYVAKPTVAGLVTTSSPKTRAQALKTLRVIGTPSDIPGVIDVLLASDDDTERTNAETTIGALAQMTASADGRARVVTKRLDKEKTPGTRALLIGLLPSIGDTATLPLLRTAVGDAEAQVSEAAVRALAAWPTGAAREDLVRLARDTRDETLRLLVLAGLVRIIGVDTHRDPEAAVADLRLAAGFAWRPEEHKLVLGVLGQFPCQSALELATGFLREESVKAEAQAAIDMITKALAKPADQT